MKTLIIYSSKTGFTKRYAEQTAMETNGMAIAYKEAKSKEDIFFEDYDAIIYGGWVMAGKVVGSDWFFEKAKTWKAVKLAVFGCGASPKEAEDVATFMETMVPAELQDRIMKFYLPGGLNYEKMNMPSKLMMKALAASIRKKKDATEDDKKMAEMISKSYDISDMKYVKDIVNWL